jgi:hypothetical protein
VAQAGRAQRAPPDHRQRLSTSGASTTRCARQDVDVVKFDLADLSQAGRGLADRRPEQPPGRRQQADRHPRQPRGQGPGRHRPGRRRPTATLAWVLGDAPAEARQRRRGLAQRQPRAGSGQPAFAAPVVTAPAPAVLPTVQIAPAARPGRRRRPADPGPGRRQRPARQAPGRPPGLTPQAPDGGRVTTHMNPDRRPAPPSHRPSRTSTEDAPMNPYAADDTPTGPIHGLVPDDRRHAPHQAPAAAPVLGDGRAAPAPGDR